MALYAGSRDVSLVRHLNRELLHRIIATEVYVYKVSVQETRENIYGESVKKVFYNPMRITSYITRDEIGFSEDESNNLNYSRDISFGFIRDDLRDLSLVINAGDVVEWDKEFYELTMVTSNQLWSGRNPETLAVTVFDKFDEFGYKIGVVAKAVKVTAEKLGIKEVRYGG